MKLAHEAFQVANALKVEGDLLNAEKMFTIVIENAPVDSNLRYEASEELNYNIPLMRIQRLLWDGKTALAERELLALQQKFEDQPVRRQQIGRIINGLRNSNSPSETVEPGSASERLIMRQVKALMHGFYVDNQRYPTSKADLLEVLPEGQPPLTQFEVKGYSTNGAGYLLVLRNRSNEGHILTIQNTGLMQHQPP